MSLGHYGRKMADREENRMSSFVHFFSGRDIKIFFFPLTQLFAITVLYIIEQSILAIVLVLVL
jgi:hypothetical protein